MVDGCGAETHHEDDSGCEGWVVGIMIVVFAIGAGHFESG